MRRRRAWRRTCARNSPRHSTRFTIQSPWTFQFDGEPIVDVERRRPRRCRRAITRPLIQAIQATFYDRCYTRRPARVAAMPAADPGFVQRLAAANAGREGWDKGWVVHQFGAERPGFCAQGRARAHRRAGGVPLGSHGGEAPQIGASVSLRVPRETLEAQPGYYFAFGETLDELADQLSIVRFYFNCRADGAAALLGALTGLAQSLPDALPAQGADGAGGYDRADAAVLYVGARYFPIVARIVMQMRDRVPLEDAVPLFTKRLWPGVGVAMEPGSGESFGSHRSRLVAEGLVDAWRQATCGRGRGSRQWPSASPLPASTWRGPGWGRGRPINSLLPATAELS